MGAATIGMRSKSRRRSGDAFEFVAVIGVVLLRCALALLKILWSPFYYVLIYDKDKVRAEKEKAGKIPSLRKMPEWQAHYKDARAIFVRISEQALGAENLKCACCPTTFPTYGKRGFHVDHIYPVSSYPEVSFDIENFQLLCETCNIHKSDNDPLVADRRPEKLRFAAARARRSWLRKHGGKDPIHEVMAAHAALKSAGGFAGFAANRGA